MASTDRPLTRSDIDEPKLARLTAEHAATMSANIALGERVNDTRRRLIDLVRQRDVATAEVEHNEARRQVAPDRVKRRIATIDEQILATEAVQAQLAGNRTVAVRQASTLGKLLAEARTALALHGLHFEILDPFGAGDPTIGVRS